MQRALIATDSLGLLQSSHKQGWLYEAITSAQIMHQQGVPVSNDLAYCLVEECTKFQDIDLSRRVYSFFSSTGLDTISFFGDHLIRLLTSCGAVAEANEAFNKVLKPSQYTWNAIIASHAKLGKNELAMELYDKMLDDGTRPDKVIFLSILKACGNVGIMEQGRHFHEQIIETDLHPDVVMENTILDMYSKCGNLGEARVLFDKLENKSVVSWNAMIAGYVQHGESAFAQKCFEKMQLEGLKPNVSTWTAIITGHAQQGEGCLALQCFNNMQHQGIRPNRVTFLSILKACTCIGALEQARHIHGQIIQAGFQSDMALGNTLVDLYAKCGYMAEAREVLNNMVKRDVVSWNAIIAGYAQCSNTSSAGQCLRDMQGDGIKPNEASFATILAACSHAGLVAEGSRYLKSMREVHGIIPDSRHYTCMVDLLGRAGYLNEAEILLQALQPEIMAWTSLLCACRAYNNVEIGKQCFGQIMKLDSSCAGAYVVMSGIYSDAGMGEDARMIDELRQDSGAWKKPAKAWIEVNKKVHEFIVGDETHPQIEEIQSMWETLITRMKNAGYSPNIELVTNLIPDWEKEDALYGHCEKLAIAFGLVSTPSGTTIRITKNLRMCVDCHNATKFLSKIEKREIIIRDAYHMHSFNEGLCSCGA